MTSHSTEKDKIMNNIAFIGLGVMGSPMASNLARKGHLIKGWNRTQDRPLVRQAAAAKVIITPTIAEAVKDADNIFICVSDIKDVKSVIFGKDGIAENAKHNALIVDFSTIGATAVCDIAAKLEEHDLRFMDAPISGGDVGAQNGTLTIMVGGNNSDFEQCKPYFEAMGETVVHCGEVGSGQAVKLCNQVLCAIQMIGLCESIQLAHKLNVDPNLIVQVCSTGAAGSWALSNLGPKVIQSDLAPGFMVKHILKDLRLVQESSGDSNLPGVTLANQLFRAVQEMGSAEQGTQAMIRAYQEI